jgi:hyperosmotically inducible protein
MGQEGEMQLPNLGRTAAALALAFLTAACAETDTGITTAVNARLAADDEVSTYNIDVETADGVVTLTGTVDDPRARERALELARNTDGVRDVVDRLTVSSGTTPTGGADAGLPIDAEQRGPRDAEADVGDLTANAVLTSKVKTQLLADRTISGLKIDVDSRAGVVTLTGTVSSETQKARALRIARETEGVKSVVDQLKIGE